MTPATSQVDMSCNQSVLSSRRQRWLSGHTLSSSSRQEREEAASTSACIRRQRCKAGSGSTVLFHFDVDPVPSTHQITPVCCCCCCLNLDRLRRWCYSWCARILFSLNNDTNAHVYSMRAVCKSMQVVGDRSTLRQDTQGARCGASSQARLHTDCEMLCLPWQ